MSRGRLSTHLPRLAALILSMAAAAGSYSVHADRSAASREKAGDQVVGPAADSGRLRHRTPSHAKRGHGGARTIRRARTRSGAARMRSEPPARAPVIARAVVRRQCPPARQEDGVDRELRRLSHEEPPADADVPPAPAAPAPAPASAPAVPAPAPPAPPPVQPAPAPPAPAPAPPAPAPPEPAPPVPAPAPPAPPPAQPAPAPPAPAPAPPAPAPPELPPPVPAPAPPEPAPPVPAPVPPAPAPPAPRAPTPAPAPPAPPAPLSPAQLTPQAQLHAVADQRTPYFTENLSPFTVHPRLGISP
jgi:hypothetical protein